MKTLHLNLKRKWFDMIKSGQKKEEYREIKTHWISNLIDFKTMHHSQRLEIMEESIGYPEDSAESIESLLIERKVQLNDFDSITFSNGYAKNRPQFKIEIKGFEIKEGKKDWGAEKNKKYFTFKLGGLIQMILILLFPLLTFAQYPNFTATTERGAVLMSCKKDHVSMFFNKHWSQAKTIEAKYDVPFQLVLAQMALESGWGSSSFAKERCNYLGIKFEGKYAYFKSLDDCLDVYGRVLNQRCYKNLRPRTVDEWLGALKCCGYATSKQYQSKLLFIIKKYNLQW